MGYSRAEVRRALSRAKEAGKDCTALHSDARDTEITLEKWGFLPGDAEKIDKRVADWYVKNGLASRASASDAKATDMGADVPPKMSAAYQSQVSDNPQQSVTVMPTDAAMSAAEAALSAAQAALALARAMSGGGGASAA